VGHVIVQYHRVCFASSDLVATTSAADDDESEIGVDLTIVGIHHDPVDRISSVARRKTGVRKIHMNHFAMKLRHDSEFMGRVECNSHALDRNLDSAKVLAGELV